MWSYSLCVFSISSSFFSSHIPIYIYIYISTSPPLRTPLRIPLCSNLRPPAPAAGSGAPALEVAMWRGPQRCVRNGGRKGVRDVFGKGVRAGVRHDG